MDQDSRLAATEELAAMRKLALAIAGSEESPDCSLWADQIYDI
jgi:hypothetical protein